MHFVLLCKFDQRYDSGEKTPLDDGRSSRRVDLNVGCGQMEMHFHDLVGCRVSGL